MQSTLHYLEKLIAFPTVSRDSNLELIDFVARELNALGITSTLTHNEDGKKANLWPPSDLPISRALRFPGTPMWCQLRDRTGAATPSGSHHEAEIFIAVAAPI